LVGYAYRLFFTGSQLLLHKYVFGGNVSQDDNQDDSHEVLGGRLYLLCRFSVTEIVLLKVGCMQVI